MKLLSFKLNVFVNETWFHEVLIDSHVLERHGESMTTHLVLKLVSRLHLNDYKADNLDNRGFSYFVTDNLILDNKSYRMVWLIPPESNYIGVRTAFRRTYGKKI